MHLNRKSYQKQHKPKQTAQHTQYKSHSSHILINVYINWTKKIQNSLNRTMVKPMKSTDKKNNTSWSGSSGVCLSMAVPTHSLWMQGSFHRGFNWYFHWIENQSYSTYKAHKLVLKSYFFPLYRGLSLNMI
jgi:hypothetical protein